MIMMKNIFHFLLAVLVLPLSVNFSFAQSLTPPTDLQVSNSITGGSSTNLIVPLNTMPLLVSGGALPWSGAGVSGGIPDYAYCNSVKDYGAVGDGATDDYSAFAKAIAACTNGGYVWIPPGTYYLSDTLVLQYPHQIELRGAGPDQTILESHYASGRAGIDISKNSVGEVAHSAVSGYSRGSTAIVMSSVSSFAVGMLANVRQSFDSTIAPGNNEDTQYAVVNQTVTITNISGNTVYFQPPLYSDYNPSLNPIVGVWPTATRQCGVRNLRLNLQTSASYYGIRMYVADNCWIDNCVVSNAPLMNIRLQRTHHCEVNGCLAMNHPTFTTTDRYGIQVITLSSDNLIQNNTAQGNNLSFVVQQGCVGNVIAYNFSDRCDGPGYPTTTTLREGIVFHGTFPCFNLVEGNVVQNIDADPTWGSAQTNTLFRNWCTLKCLQDPNGVIYANDNSPAAIRLAPYCTGNVMVGNVLSKFTNPTGSMYEFDSGITNTLFLHGNFDFVSGSTQWKNGVSRTLPDSLYLASKPAWFGNLQWPPIGPDVNTSASLTNAPVIPAQARFFGLKY